MLLELQTDMTHAVESCHWYVSQCRRAFAVVVPIVVYIARCSVVAVEYIIEVSTKYNLLQAEYVLAKIQCICSIDIGLRETWQLSVCALRVVQILAAYKVSMPCET